MKYMGFWRNLIFGAPKVRVQINPRTGRAFTREEVQRIFYQRQQYREGNIRSETFRVPIRGVQPQKKKSFWSEMFSTEYHGPLPNAQRQIPQKKKGIGLMGNMRRSAMWSTILRR